jgi:RNA polymerase sigma-70 factor (ECF subfamily)
MPEKDLPPPDLASAELEAQIERHAARVRAAAARYRLPPSDVDEVFQEVRIRLWRTLKESGNIAAAPASYVYRTALSAAVDLIRKRRARPEEELDVARAEGNLMIGLVPAASRDAEANELADLVEREIAQLPEDRALAVRMHLSGYPREEIAQLLRWSEPRTRHLIYRGLEDLRRRLKARGLGQ